jgi:3-hydroxybutyryl-CoA dehydrogenase
MTIRRVAVLGAGTMGHGIAHAAMAGGFETRLFDVAPEALQQAVAAIEGIVAKAIELGKCDTAEGQVILAGLHTFDRLEPAVGGADFVIEAVPERMDLKLGILGDVDRLVPPSAVITSNTSALSLTEMAAALKNPRRFAGMHFFNPVHKMKLVEVVRALETAPETIDTVVAVAEQMGKETVTVQESPGFITSRVNAMIGNEAFYMLEEGIASAEDIDKALKLGLNHPMGPFELVDLVGLDVRLAVLQYLHRTLGDKYRPCPLLEQYVKEGRLGRKTGRGVYEY